MILAVPRPLAASKPWEALASGVQGFLFLCFGQGRRGVVAACIDPTFAGAGRLGGRHRPRVRHIGP